MNRVVRTLALVAALAATGPLRAAAPVLDYLYPAGGRRGSSVQVEAAGKFDPWPLHGWADCEQIHVEAGKTSGTLKIRIDPDAPAGPHLLRVYNADGASALRCFIVGDQEEVAEVEPNDELAKAQPVKLLPATINGRLEKAGDVDRYAVHLDEGQCVVASLQGRRLGSPMDPMLHLEDSHGIELAFAHDGLGLDPLLVYRATRTGSYLVRVSAFAYPPAADVKLTGAKADVYRLSLTTGPFVRGAMPSGVTRGKRETMHLIGWNLDGSGNHADVDATNVSAAEDHLFIDAPGGEGRLRIETSDAVEWTREEYETTGRLAIPAAVTGVLERAGRRHEFLFAGEKGRKLSTLLRPAAIGSTFAGTLRIEDAEGKTLARSDDSSLSVETSLDWMAPADGVYRIVVADLYGKGGPDYLYRLQVARPASAVRATLDAHEYRITPGKAADVKLTVAREKGNVVPLRAVAEGLPAGVTATAVTVPDKGGEVVVKLTAAVDARPFSGPIRFLLSGPDASKPQPVIAVYTTRQEKDGVQEMVDQTDAAWLTVLAAPATRPTTRPATKPADPKGTAGVE